MLYEYALNPGISTDWKTFLNLVDNFGSREGRMISCFPGNWKKLVYESCGSCSDTHKKRIEVALEPERINTKLIKTSRSYNTALQWLENAEVEHFTYPFRAIITVSNPNSVPEVLIADSLDETSPLWNVPQDSHILRTPEAMAECVGGLLTLSTEILFIDPHFSPAEGRFSCSLEQFVLKTINARRPIKRIEYHLKYDDTKPDCRWFKSECERRVSRLIPQGTKLKLVRWQERDGGERFHDRYILTEVGGVCFTGGLDAGSDGETTYVSLMGHETRSQVWHRYQLTTPEDERIYELVDEAEIIGEKVVSR